MSTDRKLAEIRAVCDREIAIGLTMGTVSPERYGRIQFAQRVINLLDGVTEVRHENPMLTDWGDPDGPKLLGLLGALSEPNKKEGT